MEWDEATCGQMVYLYNETQVNFGGRTAAFFASMARPDKQLDAGETAGKTLRIASIDIGGGTTDLAITNTGWMRVLAIMSKSAHVYCSVKGLKSRVTISYWISFNSIFYPRCRRR